MSDSVRKALEVCCGAIRAVRKSATWTDAVVACDEAVLQLWRMGITDNKGALATPPETQGPPGSFGTPLSAEQIGAINEKLKHDPSWQATLSARAAATPEGPPPRDEDPDEPQDPNFFPRCEALSPAMEQCESSADHGGVHRAGGNGWTGTFRPTCGALISERCNENLPCPAHPGSTIHGAAAEGPASGLPDPVCDWEPPPPRPIPVKLQGLSDLEWTLDEPDCDEAERIDLVKRALEAAAEVAGTCPDNGDGHADRIRAIDPGAILREAGSEPQGTEGGAKP